MDSALTAISVVLYLVALWAGFRKVRLSSFTAAFLSIIELVLTALAVIRLGWVVGVLVVVGTNFVAVLAYSARLPFEEDGILTHAATQSGATSEEMKALAQHLGRSHKVFPVLGPIGTARLIDYLSQRARSTSEIEQMAPAIAMLWVVHRPELEAFVGEFDRLLRLWRKPASEAMRVADVLAAATQQSAATFQEMLDAMIACASSYAVRDPSV